MNTVFLLLAQYGTAQVPLEVCCGDFFGMSSDRAAYAAGRHQLPVPAFKAGGPKSPWLVDIRELAAWIDKRRAEASEEWRKVKGNSLPYLETISINPGQVFEGAKED